MKKFILLFFLLFIIFLLFKKDNIETVSYLDIEENNILCLEVKDLSDKNILLKLNNTQILYINPYINPLYKERLNYLKKYTFLEKINENSVRKFTKYYLNELKNHGFQKDYYQLSFYGIPIQKIYLQKDELKEEIKHKIEYTVC